MFHCGEHAVVEALHVHAKHPIKIRLCGALKLSNVRNSCIVHENVDPAFAKDASEDQEMFERLSQTQPIGRMAEPEEIACFHVFLTGDVAFPGAGQAARLRDLPGNSLGLRAIDIQQEDASAAGREAAGDGSSNSPACAGDDCGSAL
jgi:hypothetical protein